MENTRRNFIGNLGALLLGVSIAPSLIGCSSSRQNLTQRNYQTPFSQEETEHLNSVIAEIRNKPTRELNTKEAREGVKSLENYTIIPYEDEKKGPVHFNPETIVYEIFYIESIGKNPEKDKLSEREKLEMYHFLQIIKK